MKQENVWKERKNQKHSIFVPPMSQWLLSHVIVFIFCRFSVLITPRLCHNLCSGSVLLCCNWTNQPLLYPNFRHHYNPKSRKWKPLSKKQKNGNVGIWVWFLDLESWVSLWWTCYWFHQRLSTCLLPRYRFSLVSPSLLCKSMQFYYPIMHQKQSLWFVLMWVFPFRLYWPQRNPWVPWKNSDPGACWRRNMCKYFQILIFF